MASSNDAIKFLVVRAGNAEAFEKRLAKDPNVISYEEDLEQYSISLVPTDSHYAGYQYSLQSSTTGIESAWDITMGSHDVKVCVVDTGQYRAHQDLQGAHWAEWKDFVGRKRAPYDDNGHGTHVTGTIGAVTNNDKGIAGIAQVSLAGAKVLSRTGSGTNSAVANGITWCADIDSDIISLSLGGGFSQAVSNAVSYASSQGSLVVAAAGNAGPCTDCVSYPAKLPLALAVSCTDSLNRQCLFSSEGPEVDLAAPGKDIPSTYP
ncbi:MAG TPA: S8 family serine peptidase, partial [Candidatus Thermoplasmatota archaeon]